MSLPVPTAYEKLKKRFAELSQLDGAAGILNKDAETFMAPGSEEDRSNQLQTMAVLSFRLITDPQVKDWLDRAEATKDTLSPGDQRNLFLMRRQWAESNILSEELAQEMARIGSEGNTLHTKLKSTGDWSKMRDWYEHSFETLRTVGEIKRRELPGFASTYEALLNSFSPGMKDATIAREFAALEKYLPALVREARAKQDAAPRPIEIEGSFPKAQQQELCDRILKATGFDFSRGRFDLCDAHPSSGGTSDDARITGRFDANDFLSAVYAAIHEGGHAQYDQNRDKAWRYQPAGSHLGMGIHESQSRIMEVQACHTPEFFQYLSQQAKEVFNRPNDDALSPENLERLVNRVEPSLIRIEADEMTYPAHVILRYTLEKAMVEGTMTIDELPQRWNEGMQRLLGITPPDPSKGHMQDVHWPCGLVGYFPAYTLGDMGAAQFFAAACRAKPEIRSEIGKGNFKPLNDWLNENVRGPGALLTPAELFTKATGEDLNAKYYLNHLSERYLGKPFSPATLIAPANDSNPPGQNLRSGFNPS